MISNCGHDENGRYKGGKAGDQSKTEWYIRKWYNGSWSVVLRHPNAKVRELIARLAEDSANNNYVGYNQNKRTTFWTQLVKAGYEPSKINTNCDTDCSAGESAIIKATGYLLGLTELQNVSEKNTTSTLKKALTSVGFTALTDKKYLTSDKYLLRGDILLREGHHVTTNLTNGANVSTPANEATVTITPSKAQTTPKDYIKKAQNALNIYINAELAVDGSIGALTRKATVKALKYSLNRDYGLILALDGVIGANTLNAIKGKSVKKGKKSFLVTWVEITLMLLGYYTSTIEIAGVFGAGLDKSVRKFQSDNGLEVDGSVGQNTINKILNNLSII